jgi:hypothetical protein
MIAENARLIVLKLFLNELGVSTDADRTEDRNLIQPAVYIGQRAGVDLGYRFGWFRFPFCPDLAGDSYELFAEQEIGFLNVRDRKLHPVLRSRLEAVKPLLDHPVEVLLSRREWLQLVMAVDFLQKVSRYSPEKARDLIREKRPTLAPWFDAAMEQIEQSVLAPKREVVDHNI